MKPPPSLEGRNFVGSCVPGLLRLDIGKQPGSLINRSLADLKSGRHNLEILGKDKTQNLIESYERLIKECQSLIAGYKDRRDR
jgi:hypothetical protein